MMSAVIPCQTSQIYLRYNQVGNSTRFARYSYRNDIICYVNPTRISCIVIMKPTLFGLNSLLRTSRCIQIHTYIYTYKYICIYILQIIVQLRLNHTRGYQEETYCITHRLMCIFFDLYWYMWLIHVTAPCFEFTPYLTLILQLIHKTFF